MDGWTETLSDRLEDLIRNSGKTAARIAEEMGVGPATISEIRNRKDHDVRYRKLVLIADYFNVSLDYLVGRAKHKFVEGDKAVAAETTGLSSKAVETLQVWKSTPESGNLGIINEILEGRDRGEWMRFLDLLRLYLHGDFNSAIITAPGRDQSPVLIEEVSIPLPEIHGLETIMPLSEEIAEAAMLTLIEGVLKGLRSMIREREAEKVSVILNNMRVNADEKEG